MENIQELLSSIAAITEELMRFERKYGIASEHFYALYQQGKLDDGEVEITMDFVEWAGWYEALLERRSEFERISRHHLAELEARSKESIQLLPLS